MTDRSEQLILEDAVNVLQDVLQWHLSPARWEAIGAVIEVMEADTADLDAISDGTSQLEMAGPVRITRIGSTPTEPPPQKIQERLNTLVEKLSGKA